MKYRPFSTQRFELVLTADWLSCVRRAGVRANFAAFVTCYLTPLLFSDPLVQLVVWLLNFNHWHRDCAFLQVDGFVDARIGESAATPTGRLYNPSYSESPPRGASRKHKLHEAPAASNTRTRSS